MLFVLAGTACRAVEPPNTSQTGNGTYPLSLFSRQVSIQIFVGRCNNLAPRASVAVMLSRKLLRPKVTALRK